MTKTRKQSDTVVHHYVLCRNEECGHTWRASVVAEVTFSPSSTPNPMVVLPMASHIRRDLVVTHLRLSGTVEHQSERSRQMNLELNPAHGPDGPP